jgi:hypothetical protein
MVEDSNGESSFIMGIEQPGLDRTDAPAGVNAGMSSGIYTVQGFARR